MTTIISADTIYLATRNHHKISEIQYILGSQWNIKAAATLDQNLSWQETGTSFEQNAKIKVEAVKNLTSGFILGEDSGLCVDYLKGDPGIYSARYAGTEGDHKRNNLKLLDKLKGVPLEQRTAYFICCLVFSQPCGKQTVFTERCYGHILEAPQGRGGFGYDPLFKPRGRNLSLAELGKDEKNRISHRYKALMKWKSFIS